MVHLDIHEAVLFRLLTSFFGEDRVIPHMSVLAVCGGQLPFPVAELNGSSPTLLELSLWAKKNRCLFTVVDTDDSPKVVFEIFDGVDTFVVASQVEHQRYARPLLTGAGVKYLTISHEEIDEITDPQGRMDFFHWLKDRFEDDTSSQPF